MYSHCDESTVNKLQQKQTIFYTKHGGWCVFSISRVFSGIIFVRVSLIQFSTNVVFFNFITVPQAFLCLALLTLFLTHKTSDWSHTEKTILDPFFSNASTIGEVRCFQGLYQQ